MELPGCETTEESDQIQAHGQRYKVRGIVTNRDVDGHELVRWYRERCGKSEEVHAVMKDDLAGGKLPSGDFGENAAWWGIMILALNLNAAMKRLVLPQSWRRKRLKAIRFGLINLAGQVRERSRQLQILISPKQPAYALLQQILECILILARGGPLLTIFTRSDDLSGENHIDKMIFTRNREASNQYLYRAGGSGINDNAPTLW